MRNIRYSWIRYPDTCRQLYCDIAFVFFLYSVVHFWSHFFCCYNINIHIDVETLSHHTICNSNHFHQNEIVSMLSFCLFSSKNCITIRWFKNRMNSVLNVLIWNWFAVIGMQPNTTIKQTKTSIVHKFINYSIWSVAIWQNLSKLLTSLCD